MIYALIYNLDTDKKGCCVKNADVARKLNIQNRTLQNHLEALIDKGLVIRQYDSIENKNGRRLYAKHSYHHTDWQHMNSVSEPVREPTQEEKLNGIESKSVLEFLNNKTGKAFRPTKANLDLIQARFREGYTVQELKTVVARKCLDWKSDPKMREYLRPATLFGAKNFNQYIGECI